MSPNLSALDEAGKHEWERSYQVKVAPALWCDEPVPFVKAAVLAYQSAKAGRVLEIPCGDGKNTVYLAKHLPFLVGADASQTALEIADRRLQAANLKNYVLCRGDAFATQFAADQFDGIFCCDMLGHLERPDCALVELVRILRPGGLLIGNVFAMGDSTRTAERMVRIRGEEYRYDDRFYFRFFTDTEVNAMLAPLPATVTNLELSRWMEGPHEGYREYPHEHQSWVFSLYKKSA